MEQGPRRLETLRALLRQYPALTPAQLHELRQLYREARATEVIVLLGDPELFDALKKIDPPVDIAWDRAIAWATFFCAAAMILWLMLR